MSHKKEIVTAAGTLAIAVGIGFVMQSSEAAKERYGSAARASVAAQDDVTEEPVVLATASVAQLIEVQAIELTSATEVTPVSTPRSEATVQRVAAPATDALIAPPQEDTAPKIAECEMTATATAVPGGMVMLDLDAPCAPNERLTVHHNGLIFTQATDDTGALEVLVPALTEDGVFIMAFSNGDGAVAQASVPDLGAFSRVALQWRGQAGFQLHAREFGASYGDAGHVWSGGDVAATGFLSGETGSLMRLGDPELADPLLAEVYTFASGRSAREGLIDLSVEAEITMENCGLEVEAQTLEMSDRGTITTRDLTLAVPACDAVGDFLVLNNLVTDMKVASN